MCWVVPVCMCGDTQPQGRAGPWSMRTASCRRSPFPAPRRCSHLGGRDRVRLLQLYPFRVSSVRFRAPFFTTHVAVQNLKWKRASGRIREARC
jgi:hypothetical protein